VSAEPEAGGRGAGTLRRSEPGPERPGAQRQEREEEATLSPREQRRLQRQHLSRMQILDAAEEAFARKGFHETTVAEIAMIAEFSVGGVYGFFTDKDDLFVQVWMRRGAEFIDGMRRALDSSSAPRRRLHDLADFEVGFFREHVNFGRLFLRASGLAFGALESKIDRAMVDNYVDAMNLQANLFRDGHAAGDLRAGDPEVLALLFSGLVSAYQGSDPVVVTGAPPGTERMPLEELHEILDAAFGA
jgi:AcrR family transcriptional regulator